MTPPPEQLDFLVRPNLNLRLATASEPRLWVRRLVIWSAPGEIRRDVHLRPGLNIVWSPDPAEPAESTAEDATRSIGHTSGKTLFCRLVRYCLGEERYSTDDQRDRIARTLKEGLVGAEVVVDGIDWAIVRSIGVRRRHVAVKSANLDALAAGSESQDVSGIAPFLAAVEAAILTKEVLELFDPEPQHRAWLVALAWLCRDQDCRLSHVLEWRDPASDSRSPVRNMSRTELLEAMRVLLGAIRPEEQRLSERISSAQADHTRVKEEISHRKWALTEGARKLAIKLEMDPKGVVDGPLGVQLLRDQAGRAIATTVLESDLVDLEELGDKARAANESATKLETELAALDAKIPVLERLLSRSKSAAPGLSFEMDMASHPLCPVCDVEVDRALVEGCGLSHKFHDEREQRAKWDELVQQIREETASLDQSKTRRCELVPEATAARARADDLARRADGIRRARQKRTKGERATWLLTDEVARLVSVADEVVDSDAELGRIASEIEQKRERLGAYRDRGGAVFQRASEIFDSIVGELIDPTASGEIKHDGNGLHLSTSLNGQSTSTAINSLRVLLFDLSIMCLSMEGTGHLPAFLVHDSPREADLGLGIYHRLLRWLRDLERVGPMPLFQCIVTTTTAPPKELQSEPWLVATLHASPAEERLFGTDL